MINLITDLISFTQPTNLDKESLSVIESIAKIKTKVNECINEFNNLENKTNEDYNNFRNEINSFKTSIEKICEDLTKDNNSFKNEFREIIKALENFNVTLEIINKQSKYIQELAKINQDNIDKGTIATKDEINKINTSLKQKANIDSIFSMSNMGQDIRQAMSGGSVAVVGENAVLEQNLTNKSVTPKKTSFMEFIRCKNIFDVTTIENGKAINSDTGALEENSNYSVSAKIPVLVGQNLVISKETSPSDSTRILYDTVNICCYDIQNNIVSYKTGSTITIPPRTEYIRIAFWETYKNLKIQIEIGSNFTDYEDYDVEYNRTILDFIRDLNDNNISDNSISAQKMQFMEHKVSVNLFNKDSEDIVVGKSLDAQGNLIDDANNCVSHKIFIASGDTVVISRSKSAVDMTREIYSSATVYAFDKHDKVLLASTTGTFTAPSRTKYIKIVFWINFQITRYIQVEKTTALSNNYTEYYNYYRLKKEYINDYVNSNFDVIMPRYGLYTIEGNSINVFYENKIQYGRLKDLYLTPHYSDIFVPNTRFAKLDAKKVTSTTDNLPFATAFNNIKPDSYISPTLAQTIKKSSICKIAKNANGNGITKKCLFIGDSMVGSDQITQKFIDFFDNDVMKVELLGSRGYGALNKHEGRGGWRAWNYAFEPDATADGLSSSVTNPFYNPVASKFDLSYYMRNQGYNNVDNVYLCLGTNDVARSTHVSDTDIALAWKTIVDNIKSYNNNIKIFIWLCIPHCALGHTENTKNKILNLHKILISNFDDRINEGIYLVDVNAVIDAENDFPYTLEVIDEYTNERYKKYTDEIHPTTERGYTKMAKMLYCATKYHV